MKKIVVIITVSISLNVFGQAAFSQIFKDFNIDGSITIYELRNDKWSFSDSIDSKKETLPASTFKIINSCIALELGIIRNENEIYKWDGKEKAFYGYRVESWNSDSDLKNAFKNSTVWFYIELAKKIEKEKYLEYLTKCNYGNLNLTEKGNDFWNIGSFGISPINQIDFLKAFYKEELPFSRNTYKTVKQLMVVEETENYTISGKTGWTKYGGIDTGWWIGYVERDNEIYFFATRLEKDVLLEKPNFPQLRKEITYKILKQINAIN